MSIDSLMFDNIISRLSNLDAEKSVLGALLLDKNVYYINSDRLFEDLFTNKVHYFIFKAIKSLGDENGKEIDLTTVFEECIQKQYSQLLKKENENYNLPGTISSLTDNVASSAHIKYHIDILHRYWKLRQLQTMNAEIGMKFNGEDEPDDIISFMNTEIVKIIDHESEDFNVNDTVDETLNNMQSSASENVIKTYIHAVDDFIYGFEQGDSVILAGAASMGKTAAALALFNNWIENGLNPVYFSREMSKVQLTSRLLAMRSDVSLGSIRKRKLGPKEWLNMQQAASDLKENKYTIDDKTSDLFQMANKIRKHRLKNNVRVFIVDYMQLVTVSLGKNVSREREVATISRTFKELCVDLGIVIINLSQLSREVSKRPSKRPQLSDLRESGSIEADADFVIFPFRPAYYDTFEKKLAYIEDAEWIIAKGRGTGLKDIPMKFKSTRTHYLNGQKVDQNEIEFNESEDYTEDF